jgi:hypothetical protein
MKVTWGKTQGCAIAALLLMASSITGAGQNKSAGAWAGTWVANSTQSKFPGPPPQLDQVTIQPDGSVAVHVLRADGKTTTDWSYKPLTGKFVPVTGREHVSVKVIKMSAYRQKQIWNKDGKTSESYSTLSRDGKTQVFHAAPGKDSSGNVFSEVVVYERK